MTLQDAPRAPLSHQDGRSFVPGLFTCPDDFETDWTVCAYCGLPASTVDHVVPASLLESVRDSGVEELEKAVRNYRRKMTVPACRECNNLAGSVFDETLAIRRHRIAGKFAHRYHKQLDTPDWSNLELAEMSPPMRGAIVRAMGYRDELRERLAHLRR